LTVWGFKELAVIVALAGTVGGGFLSFGRLTANQEATREVVDEVKAQAEETEDKVIENEKIDIRQSIILERTVKMLERYEMKK